MTEQIQQHQGAHPISLDETYEPIKWTDHQRLFAKQRKIFPRRVSGLFRNVKWWFMGVLLGIYYFLPWIRWDRGPLAPDQAVLFDIASRRFYFFGIEIWPQEVYYLVGILVASAWGLFFVTSLIGRAWCAWGCPQTVWTDLFVMVERWIEGDRNARIKLENSPYSFDKIRKRVFKHAVWIIIAMLTGGAWTFYFMDAPTLASQLWSFDAPVTAWYTIGILTFTTYLLAGFAREQVCTYMCPYSRFQSAMIDKDTFIIAYRADRGEERGKMKKGTNFEDRGHCIDCTQCVAVCPMGIDIRNGMQIECINCGLCADACNNVMDKINLPRGLIGFDSLANVERRSKGEPEVRKLLRPRTTFYALILVVMASVMLGTLLNQAKSDINVIKDRNPVMVRLSNGDVRNGYTVKIMNKLHAPEEFHISIAGLEGSAMWLAGHEDKVTEHLTVMVQPNHVDDFRIFVKIPQEKASFDRKRILFMIHNPATGENAAEENVFVANDGRGR